MNNLVDNPLCHFSVVHTDGEIVGFEGHTCFRSDVGFWQITRHEKIDAENSKSTLVVTMPEATIKRIECRVQEA